MYRSNCIVSIAINIFQLRSCVKVEDRYDLVGFIIKNIWHNTIVMSGMTGRLQVRYLIWNNNSWGTGSVCIVWILILLYFIIFIIEFKYNMHHRRHTCWVQLLEAPIIIFVVGMYSFTKPEFTDFCHNDVK